MRIIAGLQGNEQGSIIPVHHIEASKKMADGEKTGRDLQGRQKGEVKHGGEGR
jgi:hypothetical protein